MEEQAEIEQLEDDGTAGRGQNRIWYAEELAEDGTAGRE